MAGSWYQFQLITVSEARAVLAMGVNQSELYDDKIRAQRRLEPVTTPAERARNAAWLKA